MGEAMGGAPPLLPGRSLHGSEGAGEPAFDSEMGSSCREPELFEPEMAINSECDINTELPGTITKSEQSACSKNISSESYLETLASPT